MNLPTIRIKDAWLLRDAASKPLNELWGKGTSLRSDEEYTKIVEDYRAAWQPYEKKILEGLAKITGLDYNQNIIDVYIAPWFSAFSDPLVIGVTNDPDVFVDVLTHELIHRLLTDNTTLDSETYLVPEWERMFGKHSWNTTIHIPVHAVHKALYLDILKAPERLGRDIANHKKHGHKDYVTAWDYVEKNDYKQIIEALIKSYTTLSAATKK